MEFPLSVVIINSDWLICLFNEVYVLWFYESKQSTIIY